MADLVSHPDEVKVVSKRFGKGAAGIEQYLKLDGYKAVQRDRTKVNTFCTTASRASLVPAKTVASWNTIRTP